MYKAYPLTITPTGSAGSATGEALTSGGVTGRVIAVHIDYSASTPATADVTITQADSPTVTILTVSNNATDDWYYPRTQVHGTTGTGLTFDGTRTVNEAIPVCGRLKAAVAQTDPSEVITVTLIVEV